MHRKDVNERSPMRVLDASIHGGLGRGNIGIVVARHGIGKTAFLVGIALDDLMRGRKVLHIALDQPVEKTRAFYQDIFIDLAHTQALDDVWKVRLDMERNRRIHGYTNATFNAEKLAETLQFMRQHGDFIPTAIIIDGMDFADVSADSLARFREIAGNIQAELWMSAVTHRETPRDQRGIPEPIARLEQAVDVILSMAHDGKTVHVGLHKDHDNPNVSDLKLALDPTTMLLVRD